MPEELTVQTFARAVKDKHPEYENVPDQQLTIAMLKKYPEYREKFAAAAKLGIQRQMLQSEFEKANPGLVVSRDAEGTMQQSNQGTLGSRAREATIGALEPMTAGNVASGLATMGKAGLAIALRPSDPNSFTPAIEVAKGMVTAPLQPIADIYQGVKQGDYEQAARGAGGFASQTVPAVEGAVSAVKELAPVGVLREQARRGAQAVTGASAFKTTEAMAGKYNEGVADVAKRQAESNANVAAKNRTAVQTAAEKTAKAEAATKAANEAAMNEADIKTERVSQAQQEANRRAQAEHQQAVAEATAHNQNVKNLQNQAQTLDSNLREGSKALGESIVDLNDKLRAEGNAKYDAVKTAVKDDEGIPAGEMAQAAQKAKDLLKGSSENIKQIRELSQEADEGLNDIERLKAQGVSKQSIADMIEQGIIGTGENVKFEDLAGYSTEIGAKLAKGNLLPDVYQSLKSLKESIDLAKDKIAARNGVGPQLQAADQFWSKFLKVMKDKESAVADVRGRVGVLDPEYYAEPFTKGKAAGVGTQMLRDLPTQHADLAKAIADQADRLKENYATRKGLKIPAEKPVPTPPPARTAGPRAMATLEPIPEPVQPKLTPNKVITKPTAPTAQEVVNEKLEKVRTRAHNLGELHRASAFELLSLPTKSLVSNILKRPNVAEWIAQPTSADLAAASKLPPAEAAQLRAGLQQVIDQNAKAGKVLKVAPTVRAFIDRNAPAAAGTAIVGGVKSRQEALKLLNRPSF